MSDDKMWVISQNNKDKPVKLIFKDNNEMEKRYYYPEYKIVLYEFLRQLRWNKIINTQQYRSEKGKLRHYKEEEVANFLIKRGISRKQIIDECNTERITLVIKTKFPVGNLQNKYGIINLKEV